jgi:hypothetical protein
MGLNISETRTTCDRVVAPPSPSWFRSRAEPRASTLRQILVCCVAALAIGASSGCQLIMEELKAKEAGTDGAGTDAESDANDADTDATMTGPSDAGADAQEAAQLDASSEQPDSADDAEAGMLPFDTGAPDADPRACDGAASRVFFEDGDEDDFGDPSSFEVACTAPDGYVSVAGDCNDENDTVHPDQTEFFGEGYPIPGSGRISFDYDCDGDEVPAPGQALANPQGCQGLLPCTGAGYVEAARRNVPGANDHCGSGTVLSCAALLVCAGGQQVPAATPYVCH